MKPRILLIGAGSFGVKHLNTLIELEKKGALTLAGVVVKSKKSAEELKKKYDMSIYAGFDEAQLANVDAVDIVTPIETHLDLVARCLPHVHVFVEKPLVTNYKEGRNLVRLAQKSAHVLMVGHIFRFHPVLNKLKDIVSRREFKGQIPLSVEVVFVNPIATDRGRDVELEMLHPFDMIDYLFHSKPRKKHVDDRGRFKVVTLTYPKRMLGVMKLGWKGTNRERSLKLSWKGKRIVADIDRNTIDIFKNGTRLEHIDCMYKESPLEAEISTFVDAINGKISNGYPDGAVGERIVRSATLGNEKVGAYSLKKKVAVIGAGIFGLNAAIELAADCDVTVFEKNPQILSEASKINQYRHHWGYHYPRSQETVDDIRLALKDFEDRYGKAIVTEFPTYYSVAKKDSKVTAREFMDFCRRNGLPFREQFPSAEFLDRSKVSTCLKTFEPIYNYSKLVDITDTLLRKHEVELNLGEEIVDAKIAENGKKVLKVKGKNSKIREEEFDYVINATYARYNDFCDWLGFRKRPIRIDLVEVLWVKINIPKISLAVMDGMFTNIVPTGRDSIFTLVHIKESVLRRFVPKNGLVPNDIWNSAKTGRVQKIIDKSAEWFPIVKKARVLDVHHVLRGVNAFREHDDARISDVTEHGFGCYSVFGGKIINSVLIAKELKNLIVS